MILNENCILFGLFDFLSLSYHNQVISADLRDTCSGPLKWQHVHVYLRKSVKIKDESMVLNAKTFSSFP